MKVLKEKSRMYKGRAYYKYKVNLPEVVLSSAGISEGDELEVSSEAGKITLIRKNDEKSSKEAI